MGRGKSADATEFWKRYDQLAEKAYSVSISAKIVASTLSSLRLEHRFPRADEAVRIADAIGTTVESLVNGTSSERVPKRFRALFDDLFLLNEVQIDPIFRLAHSYAAEIRAENANKPSAPDPGTKANRTAARGSIHPLPGKIRKEGDA